MGPAGAHPRLTDIVGSIWRCGDTAGTYPIMSALGAGLYPGRWNTAASPLIYASETFSTALLETLVHLNGILPDGMHAIEILVPDGISIERFDVHSVPGWVADESATKAFGNTWYRENRSLLLRVPSIAAAMIDHNVLINARHPDFARLGTKTPLPVHRDRRLFRR